MGKSALIKCQCQKEEKENKSPKEKYAPVLRYEFVELYSLSKRIRRYGQCGAQPREC